MALRELASGLWVCEAFIRFYGFRIEARMAVVRLSDGRLLVYSPLPLRSFERAALDRIGPVAFVLAPNKIHNQGLGDFAAAYPEARVLAPPGLPERRPDLRLDGTLGLAPEPAWASDLDQALTRGNVFFSEVLLLHRASRTLLVADLVENLHREHLGPAGRLLLRAIGGYGRPVASPEFRWYTTQPDAAEPVFAHVATWDFGRIVPAHGRPIETEARAVFRDVTQALVAGAARRPRAVRRGLAALARWQ